MTNEWFHIVGRWKRGSIKSTLCLFCFKSEKAESFEPVLFFYRFRNWNISGSIKWNSEREKERVLHGYLLHRWFPVAGIDIGTGFLCWFYDSGRTYLWAQISEFLFVWIFAVFTGDRNSFIQRDPSDAKVRPRSAHPADPRRQGSRGDQWGRGPYRGLPVAHCGHAAASGAAGRSDRRGVHVWHDGRGGLDLWWAR